MWTRRGYAWMHLYAHLGVTNIKNGGPLPFGSEPCDSHFSGDRQRSFTFPALNCRNRKGKKLGKLLDGHSELGAHTPNFFRSEGICHYRASPGLIEELDDILDFVTARKPESQRCFGSVRHVELAVLMTNPELSQQIHVSLQ